MLAIFLSFIGFLCLLLYFGMTAVEVLIKYSLLALRLIFWFIPLWIKMAAGFFYGWGRLIYHITVKKQILRQIRESEKLKRGDDYQYEQVRKREQDESKLRILAEEYPYADRELFGELSVCIYRKEYEKIPALKGKIKTSHINNLYRPENLDASCKKKLYKYIDVKDLLPVEQYKGYDFTCDIREINGVFIILAQKRRPLAIFLWHTDAFYKALEAMPLVREYMEIYCGKKTEYIWLDEGELRQRIETLKEKKRLYTYEEVKDLPSLKKRQKAGTTSYIREINGRYIIVGIKKNPKARVMFQTYDYNQALAALPQMTGILATRYDEMQKAVWMYLDETTKRVTSCQPREMMIDED